MGIEPTNLSDILMTPEVSAEPANRGGGQDFAACLSALAPDQQSDVGQPTVVGNPTPEGEIGATSINADTAKSASANPLQALMMIADKLGLEGKPEKVPAAVNMPVPPTEGEAEAPCTGDLPIKPTVKSKGELESGDESDTDATDIEDTSDCQPDARLGKPVDLPTPPVLPNQAMQASSHPDQASWEQPDTAETAVAVASARSARKIPDAPMIALPQVNDSDGTVSSEPQAAPPVTATEDALPATLVPSASKAPSSAPAAPHATGRQRALEKASDNSRIVSSEKAPASDTQPAADTVTLADASAQGAPPLQAQAAPDIQLPVSAAADRHTLLTPSGHTPSVASPAPSATPVNPPHQQMLENLLVGNAVEDQWVDRLSQDVQTLISNDNREARLHLRPRELGDLSIKLEMHDDRAKVHFTVETAAAQSLIADASPRLQAMLENKGVKLEQSSVDIGGNGTGKGGNGGSGQQDAQTFMAKAPPSVLAAAARRAARLTAFERYA